MKRVEYLDTLRGLAIFFMIMQHAFLVHEIGAGDSTHFLSVIFVSLGMWPAAPVFMVVLGIFLKQSRKPFNIIFVRGLKLVALGYILNVIRFTIPLWIAGDDTAFDYLFEIDILQLAGLSFILLGALRSIAGHHVIFPALIGLIAFGSPYLWADVSVFTDPFIGSSPLVSFPVFPWIIYPMLGMYLSDILLNLNRSRIRWLSIIGLILAALGVLTLGPHTVYNYPQHTFDMHLVIIGFVLLFFISIYAVTHRFGFPRILSFWSQNITHIFILQWVIFGYSIIILNANQYGPWITTLIGLIVVVLVHLLIAKTRITRWLPKV